MPRVLRIINRFNLGGIAYNVSYLSKFLPKEYETLLIGGPEEDSEESALFIPKSLGLEPTIIVELRRSIHPLSDFFAYRRIKKIIKDFDPQIVHTHASKAGAVGRLAAIHCKVPIIVHTFHGHVFKGYFGVKKTAVFKYIEKYLAKKTSAIIAISEIQKKELVHEYQICEASKTFVIPLGFDLERFTQNQTEKRKAFRQKYSLKEDELAIGIIGRLAPIKNHFLFIDTIEKLSLTSKKKIRALIIGDGEMRMELSAYLQNKKLSFGTGGDDSLFIFTSWIKEVDIALAGLDLVCLTSKNEGTPVSLIEAQAAGKFIVSTDVGGVRDILHPSCGFLAPSGDAQQYYDNLEKAVREFSTLQQSAALHGKQVLETFSYQRLCKDMDELYQRLLQTHTTESLGNQYTTV